LDREERTGRPGHDGKDRTGGTVELGTRVLEKDSWDRTARGGTVGKTARPGKDIQRRRLGQKDVWKRVLSQKLKIFFMKNSFQKLNIS
jgi:hypothetical protein